MAPSDIAVSGHHLTLESRAATLPEIKPCLSRNNRSPRSNKELVDELILGRPVAKQFLLKWPPDHLVKPEKDQRGIPKSPLDPKFSLLPRHKWGAIEIEALVRERMETQGIYGVKQIFQVHQLPEHPETIKKESISKVIYHLCGYFTKQQINEFLEKIGFGSAALINFDDFVAYFKDLQVVREGWTSPETRQRMKDPRFKPPREMNLLNLHPQPSVSRIITAPFAVEQIKAMLFQNRLTVEDMFPPACLKDRGLILPPQLREAFASQGFDLEPKEFWGLWRRYDIENVGAISKDRLFGLWGLDKTGRPKLKDMMLHRASTDLQRGKESARLPTAYSVALEDLTENASFRPSWEVDPKGTTSEPAAPVPKSMLKIRSKELVSFLREKFEAPSQQLTKCFEKYDVIPCGQVSLALLKKVLGENGIECDEKVLDQMMARLDIPCDENGVYYNHFVSVLSYRAEQVKADAVNRLGPDDQKAAESGDKPNGDDVKLENSITEFLASNFLAMLKALKESDKDNTCLADKGLVLAQLEKNLKFSLTPAHKQILEGAVFKQSADGKVAYQHFMRLFAKSFSRQKQASSLRSGSSDASSAATPKVKEPLSPAWELTRRNQRRIKSLSPKRYQRTLESLKEMQENPNEENMYNLPVTMLEMVMQEVGKNKIHSLHKAFMLLTKNGKKHMNKLEFTDILAKIGIPLSAEEIDKIWSLLPLEQESGEVSMEALVGRFTPGHHVNAPGPAPLGKRPVPLSDEDLVAQAKQKIAARKHQRKLELLKAKPERCGDGETAAEASERVQNKQTLAAEREEVKEIMIQIKPQVEENMSDLRAKLRQVDSLGLGYVSRTQIENLFHQHRLNLTRKEADLLCRAFDVHGNGNFHYLRFLELYIPPVVKNSSGAPAPIDSSSIVQVLRTRILAKWKNLRRAFVQHDVNHDGYLQRSEFVKILKQHGIQLDEEDLYHLMADIDTNMDGKLSYAEFLKYFLV